MLPEIISLNKSFILRLEEFQSLLSDVDKPCIYVKDVWISIFRDLIGLSCGWRALWILSEESCQTYDLIHPTAVIVSVDGYAWDDLAANVTIKAVQDDVNLPSEVTVNIIELHPIKNQNHDRDDLFVIADWLDRCRYFFKYLWYPWDAKYNVKISEWCESHLLNRLQIQCNIQNGAFDKNVIKYYKSLVDETRHLENELTQMDSVIMTKTKKVDAIKKFIERKVLKAKLNFFEEPDLRNDLLLLTQLQVDKTADDDKKEAVLVWSGGECSTLIKYLEALKKFVHDRHLKISNSLQEALNGSSCGSVVFLPPGCHVMKSLAELEMSGAIKGFDHQGETRIHADTSRARRAVLLDCLGKMELENLVICREEGIAVQVFSNTVKITGCRIISENSSALRGIVVLSDSTLVLEDCEIRGFKVGMAVQKGGSVYMSNTRILDCKGGLKIHDGGDFVLTNVQISNCSEYGIRLESSQSTPPTKGDLNLLTTFVNDSFKFTHNDVDLNNNNSNVVIEDSLDSFQLDKLAIDDDDDEDDGDDYDDEGDDIKDEDCALD